MKSTSIRWAALPGALLALSLAACGTGDEGRSQGASGTVAVDGSSTVFPMSSAAYELLSEENPGMRVTVGASGTGGGFEKFCAGETDISDASRPIKDEEAATCKEKGVEFTELHVATDALTLVVNKDLEGVDCLTARPGQEALGSRLHGEELEASSTRPSPTRRSRCSAPAPTPAPTTTWLPT